MKVTLENSEMFDKTTGTLACGDYSFDVGCAAPLSSVSFDNCMILPGFADVHVHLREPGFSYKEDIASGTRAAAHGGYTAVCAMPNLNPVPDSVKNICAELELIRQKAMIGVYPYASVSIGEAGRELTDITELSKYAVAFSDDGRGVQSGGLMEDAMKLARLCGKIIAAHCEDDALRNGGQVNFCEYAKTHGIPGISSESEWRQVERDAELAIKTGCAYHVCHISAKESASIIREAKKSGADITCETAPHYLLLDDSALMDEGSFKMNPPLRDRADREALLEALSDGTIDMIATDHAPHTAEEKSHGLAGSLMGIVGLETAFPLLYTELVLKGVISIGKLMDLMCYSPRRRFSLPEEDGFSVWSKDEYTINPAEFLSKGRSTPFDGKAVRGKCLMTVYKNQAVYIKGE